MVAHVVLFTPTATTSADARGEFAAALEAALRDIPYVQRCRVGRRFVAGRPYDTLISTHYEYLAVLEFATREDLGRYLDHPAHAALAQHFYNQLDVAAAYDFDMVDGADTRSLLP